MKQCVYADNAATTKLMPEALDAMMPWLTEEYGNASQSYSFARKPKKAVAEAREIIANCINALPEEIFFTSGGTESDNFAIKGSAFADFEKKATITSIIEHHAILNACASIEKLGYPVAYLNPDKFGVISGKALESIITERTRLVSVMYSNNEIGTIEPIKELANVAHKYGSIFHTDAVQTVGHESINVESLGVDMLSASAHKFNGPKGIGFIYIRKGTRIQPFNDGGSQEFGLRAGTENVASIVGMACALKNNCENISKNNAHIKELEKYLLDKISCLDYIRNGSENHISGNISLSFRNADGEMLLHRMDLNGIYISTGSACDSVNTKVSHVIEAIKVPDDYAKGTIRISLGKDNTFDDCDKIALSLINILK